MFDVGTIIASGAEIIGAILEAAKTIPEWRDRRRSAEICRALRAIYFTPQGMISVLQRIGSNEAVTEEEFNQALRHFADAEWRVQDALSVLERDGLFGDLRVSIQGLRIIDMVRYQKIDLRKGIMASFAKHRRKFSAEQRKLAGEIYGRLIKLNEQLEQLDARFNTLAMDR